MSIETTIYATLAADPTVVGLVGSNSPVRVRIYPNLAPPESERARQTGAAKPYLSYQVISGLPFNYLAGRPDTERKVVQLNCVADTYHAAKQLAEAVKDALELTGYFEGERDDYFPETQSHRVMLDFSIIQ